MKDYITEFAKGELRIMVKELREDGATFVFIANRTGVSIHKLKRLMKNEPCNLTVRNLNSISTFYGKNCVNREN